MAAVVVVVVVFVFVVVVVVVAVTVVVVVVVVGGAGVVVVVVVVGGAGVAVVVVVVGGVGVVVVVVVVGGAGVVVVVVVVGGAGVLVVVATHSDADDVPVPHVYVPAPHAVQTVSPMSTEYVPREHSVHAPESAFPTPVPYVPAEQGRHPETGRMDAYGCRKMSKVNSALALNMAWIGGQNSSVIYGPNACHRHRVSFGSMCVLKSLPLSVRDDVHERFDTHCDDTRGIRRV